MKKCEPFKLRCRQLFWQGKSVAQIAERLQVDELTVRRMLFAEVPA